MNINTPLQLFTYTVDNPVEIKDLSSIANVSKVIGIDENGGFQFYIDGLPDFLQGLTSLSNNQGYAIISKAEASFPYELYVSTDDIPESVTITKLAQIATYCGTGFNLVGITITSQPSNAELSGDTASFSVEATVVGGVSLTYQWQISTDDGANWNDISGETNATLNLIGLSSNDVGNQYRVIVGATDEDSVTSDAASLTATSSFTDTEITITQQLGDITTDTTSPVVLTVAASTNNGAPLSYQWFFSKYYSHEMDNDDYINAWYPSDDNFNSHYEDYGFVSNGMETSQVILQKAGTPNEFLAAQCRISAPSTSEITGEPNVITVVSPKIKIMSVGGVRNQIIVANAGTSSANGLYCFAGYSEVPLVNGSGSFTSPVWKGGGNTICLVLSSDQTTYHWAIVNGSSPTTNISLAYYTQEKLSYAEPRTSASWELGSLGSFPPPSITKSTCAYGPATYDEFL